MWHRIPLLSCKFGLKCCVERTAVSEKCRFCCLAQVEAAMQSKASWDRITEDTLKANTPNALLNSLLLPPLEVSWIGNGSSFLVLTDANQE